MSHQIFLCIDFFQSLLDIWGDWKGSMWDPEEKKSRAMMLYAVYNLQYIHNIQKMTSYMDIKPFSFCIIM